MVQQSYALQVVKRDVLGKKVSQVRASGFVPAHIYGPGIESQAVQVLEKSFEQIYKTAGETALVYLTIGNDQAHRPVLISEVQRHPVTGKVLHVSFYQVNLKEKVDANIPLKTVGESPAVKNGAVLVIVHNEIPVRALPTDLPDRFDVDLNTLIDMESVIRVKDLRIDTSKVEIELEPDEVLVSVQKQAEEIIEEPAVAPTEVETTVQGKKPEETKDGGEVKPSQTKEEKKED